MATIFATRVLKPRREGAVGVSVIGNSSQELQDLTVPAHDPSKQDGLSPCSAAGATCCLLPSTAYRRFVRRFACKYPCPGSLDGYCDGKPQGRVSCLSNLANSAQFFRFLLLERISSVVRGTCTSQAAKRPSKIVRLFESQAQTDLEHAGFRFPQELLGPFNASSENILMRA